MLIRRKFSSSGNSRLRFSQLAPPSLLSITRRLLPTRKPWLASVKATSRGLELVSRGTGAQGLALAKGRPVVTQPVVSNSTASRLARGLRKRRVTVTGVSADQRRE